MLRARELVFAEGVGRGATLKTAALLAGYAATTAEVHAGKIAARPEVAARIAEIRAAHLAEREAEVRKAIRDALPDRQKVLRLLWETIQEAKEAKNYPSVLKGLELMGRDLGLFAQRVEARVESPLDGLTTGQLVALADALRSGMAIVLEGEAEDATEAVGLDGTPGNPPLSGPSEGVEHPDCTPTEAEPWL